MKSRLGIIIVLHLKVIKEEMCHRSWEWLPSVRLLSIPFKGLCRGPGTGLGSDVSVSLTAVSWANHFNSF